MKNKNTSEIHRPSYQMNLTEDKIKKAFDKEISRETRPTDDSSVPSSLWHGNNVCATVICQHCMKPRCIFAWRIKMRI